VGNGIGHEEVDHTLVDDESALQLLAGSPAAICEALGEFSARLEALWQSELKLARKLEIVDLIDRSTQEPMQRLATAYATNSGGASQDVIWNAASMFSSRLLSAYLHLVRQVQTYGTGWGEIRDRVPLLIARSMRAIGRRLKWQLMRYGPVDRELWTELSQLWAYVEDRGMVSARVAVYDDDDVSTLRSEFLRPLMLGVSAADSLPPERLDVAERLAAHFSDRFDLQRYPSKGCHFLVDVDLGTAPARFIPGNRIKPGARFFGPGEAVHDLEALSSSIAIEEIIPDNANLNGVSDIEMVIDVIGHLGRYWWARRPGRREERKVAVSKISVIQGFQQIVTRLSAEAGAAAPAEPVYSWKIENESEGGYGAVLPIAESEWVKVGTVLGIKGADHRSWGVGIVRRLAAREDDQRYVGIQLLARGARIVTLQPLEGGRPVQTAVLLPSHVGESVSQGEVSLLLPEGGFSSLENVQMNVYQQTYVLEPRMLIENGIDFDMAYFRIIQRAA
jgi:cyclic-di-GMP-binding protein